MTLRREFRFHRRTVLLHLAGGAVLATAHPVLRAQRGPVTKVVVPTAAGGSMDSAGRLLADTLNRGGADGRYVVENRAGAGGLIALQSVVKSPPDGQTLVIGTAAIVAVQPAVNPALPYDPLRDLSPIAVFGQGGLVIAVPAASPCRTIQDLKPLAAQAGDLAFGTGGPASFGHLTIELVKAELNVPMRHVPYRGSAPALTDLMGGLLHLAIVDAFSAVSHVQSGKIRIIAIAGPNRHPTFPDVPTLSESGVPFSRGTWVGLFGPAGLSASFVEGLSSEIKAHAEQSAFRDALRTLGFVPVFMGPDEVRQMLRKEIDEWRRTARQANVSLP